MKEKESPPKTNADVNDIVINDDNDNHSQLQKKRRRYSRSAEKRQTMKQMITANITPSSIARALNYSREYVSRVKGQLLKNPLLERKMVKQAVRNVQYFNVENYKQDKRMRPSDVLHASEIVLNRAFPVVSHHEVMNQSIQFQLSIDPEKYIRKLSDGQTPEPVLISQSQLIGGREGENE